MRKSENRIGKLMPTGLAGRGHMVGTYVVVHPVELLSLEELRKDAASGRGYVRSACR